MIFQREPAWIGPAVALRGRGERERGCSDAGRQAEPDQGAKEAHAVAPPRRSGEPQGGARGREVAPLQGQVRARYHQGDWYMVLHNIITR